jgi:hypothetical protein
MGRGFESSALADDKIAEFAIFVPEIQTKIPASTP